VLGESWGCTATERAQHFPCDDLVESPRLVAWRGVTVEAPVHVVWPWVAQVRAAPYSYDWIDNGFRRSPRQLLDLPEPVVGEPFTASRGRPLGRIADVEPGRSLTGLILGAYLSYLLVPTGGGTRLLLKVVMETGPVTARAVCLGDLVMARKQLLTWKRLAEGG
jgi:hypothetical protein